MRYLIIIAYQLKTLNYDSITKTPIIKIVCVTLFRGPANETTYMLLPLYNNLYLHFQTPKNYLKFPCDGRYINTKCFVWVWGDIILSFYLLIHFSMAGELYTKISCNPLNCFTGCVTQLHNNVGRYPYSLLLSIPISHQSFSNRSVSHHHSEVEGSPPLVILQIDSERSQLQENLGCGGILVVGRPVESCLPIHVCHRYVCSLYQQERE